MTLFYSDGRAAALADGTLVDCTEWAGPTNGIIGGILGNGQEISTAMTATLLAAITPGPRSMGDLRGRAHDVLWMTGLKLRRDLRMLAQGRETSAIVRLRVGRKNLSLLAAANTFGITIGLPEDFPR